MKRPIFYLAILCILFGCKKEGGKLLCTMTYDIPNKKNVGYNTKSNTDITSNQYSQFGDFIISITPSRFIAKFSYLTFSEETLWRLVLVEFPYIENDLDVADPNRLADFSNNSTVTFAPKETNVRNNMELTYLNVGFMFFYQEFELPGQYENFRGDQLQFLYFGNTLQNHFDGLTIGSEKTGCLYKGNHEDLMAPIFDPNWTGFKGTYPNGCHNFVFGNTDSTFLSYDTGGELMVRSNKYTPITLSAIPEGETKTIKGTMSFNTTDLIQIYAGKDNKAYTKDDYFVYAPNFWERISVSLESY